LYIIYDFTVAAQLAITNSWLPFIYEQPIC